MQDDIEIRLREEAMIGRILKEKLASKELDIEQLQSDLAASVRIQDVLQNEIQRVQDELRCLTHKVQTFGSSGDLKTLPPEEYFFTVFLPCHINLRLCHCMHYLSFCPVFN